MKKNIYYKYEETLGMVLGRDKANSENTVYSSIRLFLAIFTSIFRSIYSGFNRQDNRVCEKNPLHRSLWCGNHNSDWETYQTLTLNLPLHGREAA